MRTVKPTPLRVAGVLAALAWLTDADDKTCARNILKTARLQGLLPVTPHDELWKCNGELLGSLVSKRIHAQQWPPHGRILIGIGELTARCHLSRAEFEHGVGRMLFGHSFSKTARHKIIIEALEVAQSRIAGDSHDDSLIYETQSISVSDWNHLKYAYDWARHPPRPIVFAGYGLGFIARLFLRCAPDHLQWLTKESADRGLLLPVVAALGEACIWEEDIALKALDSRVPFIIGLGLGRLQNARDDGESWSASSVDAILVERSVPDEGRRQVSALTLKECVHAWYRQKDRAAEARRRQEILRHAPEQAIGGGRYAADEIRRLESEVPAFETQLDAVVAKLEDALRTAARLDATPTEHWNLFDPSFVDTPEIRHRFAMEHIEGESRRTALEFSLAVFDEILGTRRPEKALFENIDTIRAGKDIAYWAACSQVELSKIKGSEMGRDAAIRIARLEKAVRIYTLQPFAAARFGQRFQDALTRWSLLLQFAFQVSTSPSGALGELRDLALSSAQLFLPVASRSMYGSEDADAIINMVADAILTSEERVRSQWLQDERMPVKLTAALAWSSAATLHEKPDFARSLLERAARGTTQTVREWNASVLINLMDRAAAAMYREKRSEVVSILEIPYSLAISCANTPLARSLDLQTLLAAVNGDGIAQKKVIDNPVWNQSRTAHAFATAPK